MGDGTETRKRILLVDDHPIVRQGLGQIIGAEDDLAVCGEAEDATSALEAIDRLRPDLVIVDITLPGQSGLELIKRIKARHARLPTLVLSMHDEGIYAERALRAGARGYVMKQEATEHLLEAIRRVLGGEFYLSGGMATQVLSKVFEGHTSSSPVDLLSDRELEVFQLIGRGRGTRQIAEDLGLSVKTIETYRAHIKDKLGLGNATELVRHAVHWVETHRS